MRKVHKILLAILISGLMVFVTPMVYPFMESGYTVQAATVKLSKKTLTMNKGEKYTLKITGTKKKVKWSTSDKKIATVNSKGLVTAKGKGTATITAKVGKSKYKCKIKVETLGISKKTLTMNKGEKYTLKTTGTKKKAKWTTSDKRIATVNSKGLVTAKKKGNVKITAKIGKKSYKCKIKVEAPSISTKERTLTKGKTVTLKIKNTTQKVKWSTNNKKVATVNSKGLVTAKGKGTATITAKVGNSKYKCKIIVETPSISKKTLTINKGDTYVLKMNNTTQDITWYSSNSNVATVSESVGWVEAISKGTATITAKVAGIKYTCKVTVTDTEAEYKAEYISKNISTSWQKLSDHDILVSATNKGNKMAQEIYIDIYYYKDGKEVDSCKNYNFYQVYPGTTSYLLSGVYDSVEFDDVKIITTSIEFPYIWEYTNLTNNVTISKEKIEKNENEQNVKVTFTLKNNSNKEVNEFNVNVLYYKDGKIVGMSNYLNAHGTTIHDKLEPIKPNSQKTYTLVANQYYAYPEDDDVYLGGSSCGQSYVIPSDFDECKLVISFASFAKFAIE